MTTTRTAAPDLNYLSVSEGIVEFFSGSDEPYGGEMPQPPHILPPDPKAFDSVLKVSRTYWLRLIDLRVSQGKENSIDVNAESAFCTFDGEIGEYGVSGEQAITVKGGSHDLVFRGRIHSRGKRAHVAVGLWSDQSFDPSYNLDFRGLRHASGEPLTFILCRVNSPIRAAFGKPRDIQLPPGAKVLVLKSLAAQIEYWIKWVGVKVGVVR
jgi:hypothetical protein